MIIHTFDSRDFIFWEVYKDYYNKDNRQIYEEIQNLFMQTIDRLSSHNIKYESLKSSLTPQKDKKEIGFIFDSLKIDDSFYGGVILANFVEILRTINRTSVSFGDIVVGNSHQAQLRTYP